MCRLAEIAQFLPRQERIVDVRIEPVALVDVHHIRARGFRAVEILLIVLRHAAGVIIAVAPLLFGAQRMERRDEEIEIEMERLAGFQREGAGLPAVSPRTPSRSGVSIIMPRPPAFHEGGSFSGRRL